MARLDRLHGVKEVAQTAAVIGRTFDHATIAELAALPKSQLTDALQQLLGAELVFRRGLPPDATTSSSSTHSCATRPYESLLKAGAAAARTAPARCFCESFGSGTSVHSNTSGRRSDDRQPLFHLSPVCRRAAAPRRLARGHAAGRLVMLWTALHAAASLSWLMSWRLSHGSGRDDQYGYPRSHSSALC